MINWKLRLMNKPTLIALIGAVIALVYQILSIAGITPCISESEAIKYAGLLINLLVAIGIVVDPTTAGLSDSYRAMEYDVPNDDEDPGEDEDWDDEDEEDLDEDEYEDPADDEELPE